MTPKHEHIDLTTLQEVQRLLTSAELEPGDDAAPKKGRKLRRSARRGQAQAEALSQPADGLAPLPKRR